jgi:hypothetical protein
MNCANVTVSNLTLAGANGNTIDNAALPNPITVPINSSTITATTLTATTLKTGTAGTGTIPTLQSKNYAGPGNTNATGTIATISNIPQTAADRWSIKVTVVGISPGTSTEGKKLNIFLMFFRKHGLFSMVAYKD